MADNTKLVEITEHSLNIRGIKSLVTFSRFKAQKADSIMKGLVLADDLLNSEGGILYSSGTVLDHVAIKRLIRTAELNPEMDYTYSLQKGVELSGSLKKLIYEDFSRLTQSLLSVKTFHRMFQPFVTKLPGLLDSIFSSEQILYYFYEQKLSLELAREKRGLEMYRHSIYVMLITSAIARRGAFSEWSWGDAQLKDLAVAALLHNVACLQNIEAILRKEEEQQKPVYQGLLKQSSSLIGLLGPSRLIVEGLQKYSVYFDDITDFVQNDTDSDRLANLILVADMFCSRVFGLFGAREAPRMVVDALNVQATESKLNTFIVEQFTLELSFQDMFDFYQEINRLSRECPFGKYAWPYPMTGFKSPVVFVCKISKVDCEHYLSTVKAVNVVMDSGGLEAGEYCRCTLTTQQLLAFYEAHYEEIKADVNVKSTEVAETVSKQKTLDFKFKLKTSDESEDTSEETPKKKAAPKDKAASPPTDAGKPAQPEKSEPAAKEKPAAQTTPEEKPAEPPAAGADNAPSKEETAK